jgi:hypothetical protein
MRIVTQSEMKELEKFAQTKYHFPEKLIIENVALIGARTILEKLGAEIKVGELIFLIGKGNNGGTGLAKEGPFLFLIKSLNPQKSLSSFRLRRPTESERPISMRSVRLRPTSNRTPLLKLSLMRFLELEFAYLFQILSMTLSISLTRISPTPSLLISPLGLREIPVALKVMLLKQISLLLWAFQNLVITRPKVLA